MAARVRTEAAVESPRGSVPALHPGDHVLGPGDGGWVEVCVADEGVGMASESRRRSARGGDRWFELLQGRQFPLPLDVPLDVPPPESPLVSALETFQVPATRHVVYGIGTEIKKDRQIARLEDALFALDVHELLSWRQENLLVKIT